MMEAQHGGVEAGSNFEPVKRKVMRTPDGRELPAGRVKGVPNKLTQTLKAAVEMAARDCHPRGLAGWLVERANGSIGDRQIFAAMVAKAMPLQVQAHVDGGIRLELGWLGGRQIGTNAAQNAGASPQAIDLQRKSDGTYQIVDQSTQLERVGGGGAEAAGVAVPRPQKAAEDAEGASK